MQNWMLSLMLVTAGPIFILFGIASRNPEDQAYRWGMMVVGGLFTVLATISFVVGHFKSAPEIDNALDRRPMRLFGRFYILIGVIGALSLVLFPSAIPWEDNAPWIGWAYFGFMIWAILVGLGMEYAAWALRNNDE
jgi:hypothetical protein